ncbi:hypothetical protein [Vibrio sp. WXL103]|uniref:hypothetical protein n=1 Tax=Vibrio sp. WXL103 TaxID=3450710 RepID=UPI003EC860F0
MIITFFSKSALIISLIFLSFQVRAASDPCQSFDKVNPDIDSKEGIIETLKRIKDRLIEQGESSHFDKLNSKERSIYFTRRTGFYYTLDCSNPETKKNISRIGLFGVGDQFRPIRKHIFDGETYYFGLRSTGLHSLVKKSDLRILKPNNIYFFNRTKDITNFCTNKINCTGKDKEFSSRHHYAVMKLSDYRAIEPTEECMVYNVAIYNGSKPEENGPEFKKAQLKYCRNSHDNGIYSGFLNQSEKNFNLLPITGKYSLLPSNRLKEKVPFLFTSKKCGTRATVMKRGYLSLGGSIGAGFDFFVVKSNVEGKASIEYDIRYEEIFEANKQYIYRNYSMITIKGDNPDNLINDIIITQGCKESLANTTNEIKINISNSGDQVISLKIKKLDELSRKFFSSSGVWTTGVNSTERNQGKAWIIAGLEQYKQWREAIFSNVVNELRSIISEPSDTEMLQHNRLIVDYAYYFTDIFMATAFVYVSSSEVIDIDIGARL